MKKEFIIKGKKLLKIEVKDTYSKGQAERELAVIDEEIEELVEKKEIILNYLESLKDETI
jgi:hypothetical protein